MIRYQTILENEIIKPEIIIQTIGIVVKAINVQ